ncbi:phage tail assembly protein [Mycobacteroides chelonae]|uniref:phage tail assembly protein n=1 Tax=Mycobacteroides chelonae TaxID=1774 RepID=UPI0009929440|nr:phage tail assembly protein [Mycobacteroides chelonae]
MTNTFTLADMVADADEKYAPVALDLGGGDVVTLRNVLRIKPGPRKEALSLIKQIQSLTESADEGAEMSEEDFDTVNQVQERILGLAADKPELLSTAIGGDPMIIMEIFNRWMESTQAGEASSSES